MEPLRTTLLLGLLLVALAACTGEEEATDEPDLGATSAISATIGAQGGVLEGQAFTAFEGVRLEIPAGALTEEVEVTISTILDETPLADDAFAVGRQFTVDLSGRTLALAGQLTLPVYMEDVRAFGADLIGVKVWLKGPEQEWKLLDPLQSQGSTTTVELAAFGVAASGVKMDSMAGVHVSCVSAGSCSSETGQSTALQLDDGVDLPRLIAGDQTIYYLTRRPSGAAHEILQAVEVQVDSGETRISSELELLAGDSMRDRGLALDSEANLWVGTRRGAARLSFSGDSSLTQSGNGARAVALLSLDAQTIVWLAIDDQGLRVTLLTGEDDMSGQYVFSGIGAGSGELPQVGSVFVAGAGNGESFWVGGTAIGGGLLNLVASEQSTTLESMQTLQLSGQVGVRGGLAPAPDGGLWFIGANDGKLWRWAPDGEPAPVDGISGVSSLISDNAFGVWLGMATDPAVTHIDSSGVVTYVRLSDDTDAAARNMIPRALALTGADQVVVLTRAGVLLAL